MPFLLLLLFALICLITDWPEPRAGLSEQGSAILVGTMVLASWLTAWLVAQTLSWQMNRHPDQRYVLIRRYARWRRNHFIVLFGIYLISIYLLGWGRVLLNFLHDWTPEILTIEDRGDPPGFRVAVMLPFVVALILAWERFYKVEKTAYELGHADDRFLSRWAYLVMQVRHQFYLVVPPILLLVFQQFLFAFFPSLNEHGYMPALISLGMIGAAFMLLPMLLRYFLGLQPLPPGPLRDRLEGSARRLGFNFSNVLVWHTRHLFANAMVTGLIPWIRYVVLTDRLIDELTPEEIEAVFGHEVGHVKHHHLLFYLVFFLTSFIILSVVWDTLKSWISLEEIKAAIFDLPYVGADVWELLKMLSSFGKLFLLAGYTLFCFGLVSRRCERQADLFGATTVSTEAFINALEKVAAINGIPRHRSGNWLLSWQHPTIAQRVEFLERMRARPDLSANFHLSVQLIQIAFLYLLTAIVWYYTWQYELPDLLRVLTQY